MKTSKFEKTIRQKLESISPGFQENDWAKMQSYMHAHTPPTFWQQYGSWVGYAAAASVSAVMAFMYIGQLNKTNDLAHDVKKLQHQIELIKSAPATVQKTDTVYIVQKELSKDGFFNGLQPNKLPVSEENANSFNKQQFAGSKSATTSAQSIGNDFLEPVYDVKRSGKNFENTTSHGHQQNFVVEPSNTNEAVVQATESNHIIETDQRFASPDKPQQISLSTAGTGKTLGSTEFSHLAPITPVRTNGNTRVPYQMSYALNSRLSGKQVRKTLLAMNPSKGNVLEVKKTEKTEKVEKGENIIPQLNIKTPYRFGGGIQFEGKNQIKNVTGEILVSKKFSISSGISWVKVKPIEFFTEKIFREKTRKDFKRTHPNEVPVAFEVLNIAVKPTLVQIPLTVAFRNDLGNNFSYFLGTGTNITVKGREQISFDCRVPNPGQELLSQTFDKRMDIPVINSLNFSAGLEKSWHPIVLQMEGYLYTYFKPLSPENPRSGPGVKLKLLYQIGGKM